MDIGLSDSPEEALREGFKRLQAMDPASKVGSVHHTVPKFYLRCFARGEQVATRTPGKPDVLVRNIRDMGQRDFYTAVVAADGLAHMQSAHKMPTEHQAAAWQNGTGEAVLDGRIEDVLAVVDGWGATVLTRLTETPVQALTKEERYALTTYLSFQMTRGVRTRREIELIGEYYAKMWLRSPLSAKQQRRADLAAARRAGRTPARGNGRRLPPKRTTGDKVVTDGMLRQVGILPSPNEHLLLLADTSEQVGEHLFVRPVTVVELDEPLLVTCDEPVVVLSDLGEQEHQPSCSLTAKQRRRALAAAVTDGREHREGLHLYATRPKAVAEAEHIAMPMDPSRAVVLGPKNTGAPAHFRLEGALAADFAADLNARLAAQAYLWVAGHPDGPALSSVVLPELGPLIVVCDGGTPGSDATNRPPQPRSPSRLRRANWDCGAST